jgi:tetratricopeptide (TPR) repeat protein
MTKQAYQAELKREGDERRSRTAELTAHAQFYDGWEKETAHFRVKTNTSPELLAYYADLLESYYDLMDKRVGIKPSPSLRRTKMQVNVYKSRQEFQQLTGVSPGVAGFFSFLREELQFYHDYDDPEISEWVALHEGTHLLTYLIEPQAWPEAIWFHEAVADYFGSANVQRDKRGKLIIESGELQMDRVLTVQQAIEDEEYTPLETLFSLPQSQFGASEYAHGWSLVYFLNNSSYEKAFKKFFKDFYTIPKGVEYRMENGFPNQQGVAKMIPPEEVKRVLLDRLGVKDLAKLEQDWIAFVKAIQIDAPQARFKRAMRSFGGDEDELKRGLEDVQAAIDGGVNDPCAYWVRAFFVLASKGDREKCLEDLRKAVDLAPLDAGFRANLAQVLAGMSLSTPAISVALGEEKGPKLTGTADELA